LAARLSGLHSSARRFAPKTISKNKFVYVINEKELFPIRKKPDNPISGAKWTDTESRGRTDGCFKFPASADGPMATQTSAISSNERQLAVSNQAGALLSVVRPAIRCGDGFRRKRCKHKPKCTFTNLWPFLIRWDSCFGISFRELTH
jgi:hypothetical protein